MRSRLSGSSSSPKSHGVRSTFQGSQVLLVDPDDEAPALLAEICPAARVHDMRQFRVALVDLGDVVADQILVLHRLQRQPDAGHLADLARPQAAGIDHMLGTDRALFGDHVPASVGLRDQLLNLVMLIDLGALQRAALA